ncbi:MAG: DUF4397 domain-containing protein [Proteobacteria bacterium]|nr:DUF4397 domain-containing protein [Pseudomonadota bacterium]
MKKIITLFALLIVILTQISCGGGGGGGGDGETAAGTLNTDPNKRTSGTGVRIIHASMDGEPVDLKIADQFYGNAYFMGETFYQTTPKGPLNLLLERANSPGVVLNTLISDLKDKTEYSVLLTGQNANQRYAATLLEEPVLKPAAGKAVIQFIHALEGSGELTLVGSVTLGPVSFKASSGFLEIPVPLSGTESFNINSSSRTIATINVAVSDGSESTIVVGGSRNDGVIIPRVFRDRD